MSNFWSLFIIVLVVVSIIGYMWLLRWTMHMHTDDESDDDDYPCPPPTGRQKPAPLSCQLRYRDACIERPP